MKRNWSPEPEWSTKRKRDWSPQRKYSPVITISDSSDNSDNSDSEGASTSSSSKEAKDDFRSESTGTNPNPLLLPSLQEVILSNLGKSDLLNCRLVCQSWNIEILKILKKSDFRQNLKVKGLKRYVRRVKEESRKFIIPLHLTITMNPDALGKSVEEFKFFKELTTDVSYLINEFGPQCIAGLTLKYEAKKQRQKALRGLLDFLREISVGLKELDVTSFYILNNSSLPTALKILKSNGLIFPNLKKLYSLETTAHGQTEIHGLIIEKAPNLQILDIRHCHHKGYSLEPNSTTHNHLKLDSLKTLKFEQIDLKPFIKNFSLPKLQELEMSVCDGGADMDMYIQILSRVESTLKSLTIILNLGLVPEVKLVGIPIQGLPHLERFRIKLNYGPDTPIFVNPEDYNFVADALPSLKFIDIPIGYMFRDGWPLLSVTHLTIRVNQTKFLPLLHKHTTRKIKTDELSYSEFIRVKSTKFGKDKRKITMKHNIRNVMMRFPNVTTLSIVNECYENARNMIQFMSELFQGGEEFYSTQKIDTFQIKNYDQDYLTHLLNEVKKPPRIILENFKSNPKLEHAIKKLFAQFTGGGEGEEQESQSQPFDRMEFTKYDSVPTNFSGVKNRTPVEYPLKNLKRMRVEGCCKKFFKNSEYRTGNTRSYSDMTATPCLSLLPKHFPHLSQVELSRSMTDSECSRIDLERTKTKYPNLTINLI